MTDFRQRVETTYADLRPTDLVIDKSGQAWPIDIVLSEGGFCRFYLKDPVTKVNMHYMARSSTDSVTVSRVPTQADEAAKLEVDFPKSSAPATEASGPGVSTTTKTTTTSTTPDSDLTSLPSGGDSFATMEKAVAAVEAIGGTVEAEVTANEVDAARAATEDAPVRLPTFESMTPLEQRSHLYLLHGVYAADLKSRDELAAMHNEAHAGHESGKLNSRYIPHVHTEVK